MARQRKKGWILVVGEVTIVVQNKPNPLLSAKPVLGRKVNHRAETRGCSSACKEKYSDE